MTATMPAFVAITWSAVIVLGMAAVFVGVAVAGDGVTAWAARRRRDAECALTARRLIEADARNTHPTGRNR